MTRAKPALFALFVTALVTVAPIACAQEAQPDPAPADAPPSEDSAQDASSEGAQHQEEARALHAAGRSAFEDGRFEAALRHWRAAYELAPLPELHYNMAMAHDRLEQVQPALAEYRAYLDAAPDGQRVNYVRRRIAILETERRSPEPGEASDRGPNVGAIVLTVTAGALLVGGVITALVADAQYSALEEACPARRCPPDRAGEVDTLRAVGITADVLFAVGAAAAIGSIIWWIAGDAGREQGSARLRLGPGGASLSGRF